MMEGGGAIATTEGLEAIEDATGVEEVLAAMREYPESAEVQEEGCKSLFNMTYGDAKNRTRAVNAGAVEAVVATMHRHEGSAEVQEWAERALCNMPAENSDDAP